MANKFLPFVVPTSTPLQIFETLISRSKGLNLNSVASIFNIVLKNGVSSIRDFCKALPDMSTDQLYDEIENTYAVHKLLITEINLFKSVGAFISAEDKDNRIIAELKEYNNDELMLFFLVTVKNNMINDYTEMHFSEILPDSSHVLNNIPNYVKFSNKGSKVEFTDINNLTGFILYHALLGKVKEEQVYCAVLGGTNDDVPF